MRLSPVMIAARYVAARLSKVLGNLLKILYYPVHALIPRARVLIPHRAPPLWRSRASHRIPKIVWQTNYTDRVTVPVYMNYLFNRLLAPTYEFRLMTDAECAEFVTRECAAPVVEVYDRLQIGAAKADLWRLLVLERHGGVYLDMDAHVVWPLGLIIGRDLDELYVRHREHLSNFFLASVPHNPHLTAVIDAVVQNVRAWQAGQSIYGVTGPLVIERQLGEFNPPSAYFKYTVCQGSFTNEYFQYLDHPQGKWTRAQWVITAVKQ
jgi:mannosyltransferase OCH1-like enzyme